MYLALAKRPAMRGLGRIRSRRKLHGLGDDIDWSSIITTGINDAATVAKTAVTPPLYSSVINPLTGQSSITSYAGVPGVTQSLLGPSAASIFSSPMFLLLGAGVVLVLALRR